MWWDVKSFTILGRDNFMKVSLKIVQDGSDELDRKLQLVPSTGKLAQRDVMAAIPEAVEG